MLDKHFVRAYFDQIESLCEEELAGKISQIEKLRLTFTRGSEAHSDAAFMLKHIHRELLQRQFKPAVAL